MYAQLFGREVWETYMVLYGYMGKQKYGEAQSKGLRLLCVSQIASYYSFIM